MIICKYWITQSIPTSSLSADVSLKTRTDHQTVVIDCTESTEIKYDLVQENNQESNSHHSQLYEKKYIKKKENLSDTLRDDRDADDHFFIPDDFKDPSVRKVHKVGNSCITRDAQIQTSNRKRSRRRKTKKRSIEKISHRKHCNEPRIVADFRTDSSRRNHRDQPRLRVQVLENKRAEYINKFTAVNRQIEEITATLRETCCSGESSRDTLENCDEYFSSISDDAKVNTVNWSDVESGSTIARRNTSKEKNDLVNIERIGKSKSDRCKNVQEIHVLHIDNETVSSPIASSRRNLEKISNDAFGCDSVRTIKDTVYSSNRISRNKTKNRFVKQMSLDLTKNEDKLQEFSIENKSFDEVRLKNNFAISNNDEHARDSAEGLADLEEPRYCKKIVEEKIGEVAILKDIKERIDRDFDDPPAEKSENDTEDFLTISRKSSNLDRHIIDVSSATMIEESAPLSASTNLRDPTETQIHDSMSIGAMSECSNKNSALSKYFSCTQIPISSMENEDELAVGAVDRDTIDSHSNLHSNRHYYDSHSHSSPNNCSLSNLDSSLDRSSLEYTARCDPSAQCTCPNKLESLIGTIKEPNDTFEIFEGREGFAESEICERKRPPHGEGERRSKERQAEKRYTADSTLETSKSSRYVGSIDSGVFSSSLIDLPAESIFDAGKLRFKKKRRAGKPDGSSTAGSDSSCTDDTLDRKVNDVVRDLTKNLILCERRARMKLRTRDARCVRIRGLVVILRSLILAPKGSVFFVTVTITNYSS